MPRRKHMLASKIEKQFNSVSIDKELISEEDYEEEKINIKPKNKMAILYSSSEEEEEDEVQEEENEVDSDKNIDDQDPKSGNIALIYPAEEMNNKTEKKKKKKLKKKKGKNVIKKNEMEDKTTNSNNLKLKENQLKSEGNDEKPLVGKEVEIVGTRRTDLNGLRGKVLDYVPTTSRYNVQLMIQTSNTIFSVATTLSFKRQNLKDVVEIDRELAMEEAAACGGGDMLRLKFRRTPFGNCDHRVRVGTNFSIETVKDLLFKQIYSDIGVSDLSVEEMELLFRGRVLKDKELVGTIGMEQNMRINFRRKIDPSKQGEKAEETSNGSTSSNKRKNKKKTGDVTGNSSEAKGRVGQEEALGFNELPYGGDVNLAMKNQDREAIKLIFDWRKKYEHGSLGNDNVNSTGKDGGGTGDGDGGDGATNVNLANIVIKDNTVGNEDLSHCQNQEADNYLQMIENKLIESEARVIGLELAIHNCLILHKQLTTTTTTNNHNNNGHSNENVKEDSEEVLSALQKKEMLAIINDEIITQEMVKLDNIDFNQKMAISSMFDDRLLSLREQRRKLYIRIEELEKYVLT